jgi:hypothetical protein
MTNDPADEAKADNTFNDIAGVAKHIPDAPIAPATGIAAIALNMALRYHDINTVQDGALYQQYKLEGRNMGTLHLDHVFETAIRMEAHLLGASDRIAKIVIDAIADPPPDDNDQSPADQAGTDNGG